MSNACQLVQNSIGGQTLKENFIPLNNNSSFLEKSEAYSVTIVDGEEKVVAYGAVNMYTSKQSYCLIGEVAKEYQDNTLWIEPIPTESKHFKAFKIIDSVPHKIDTSGNTLFERAFRKQDGKSAHLHLIEQLVENTFGTDNVDLLKNITVDIKMEGEETFKSLASWRDQGGFIVTDRSHFDELKVNRFELMALGEENSEVKVENITKDNLMTVLDYDADMCIFDRTEHVTALMEVTGMTGKVLLQDDQPVGYGLCLNEKIVCVYANDEKSMRQILSALAEENTNAVLTMFIRRDSNETVTALRKNAVSSTPIQRLHTRTTFGGVKWSQICCPNIGLHIF